LETMATGFRVYPFLGLVPTDVEWRLQPDEVARLLTPAVEDLGEATERRRLPFTSAYFEQSIEVEGIEVDGHVLWGMTLRLLDGRARVRCRVPCDRGHPRGPLYEGDVAERGRGDPPDLSPQSSFSHPRARRRRDRRPTSIRTVDGRRGHPVADASRARPERL